jgi:hypothetical protein
MSATCIRASYYVCILQRVCIHTYICDGQKVSNTEEEKTLPFFFLGSPKSQLATLGPEGRQKPTERKEGIATTSDSLGHIDGLANDQVE